MTDRNRRAFLAGALGGAGGAGVIGYSRRWYVARREEIRLRPVTLINGNTEPRDVYIRIYTEDGYEATGRSRSRPPRPTGRTPTGAPPRGS